MSRSPSVRCSRVGGAVDELPDLRARESSHGSTRSTCRGVIYPGTDWRSGTASQLESAPYECTDLPGVALQSVTDRSALAGAWS